MLRCHVDCPLPPPLFCASSPLWPISPCIPSLSPLSSIQCLNLLKRRCGLTVVISHHAVTVLCVTSAQYTSDRSVQGRYESQHLGGEDGAQPCRDLPILSCFILVPQSEFVCRCICVSKGGFTGLRPPASQAQHFALCITGRSVSWLLV